MSKTFADIVTEDRRLVLLRILREQNARRANSSVLTAAMDHYGHAITRDYTRTQLRWLEEQGLVQLEDVGPVLVATLTERGAECARGLAVVDGVARPSA
jgi:repressor of nif and glnA expression